MAVVELTFESELAAPPERIWAWVTSVRGINSELRPLLRMTAPARVQRLDDVLVVAGKPILRSWVLLLGLLPIDRSDLTLTMLEDGKGFLEESPMLSMKRWRHERTLLARDAATLLTDQLTFEPRFATGLVRWFVGTVFRHRHRVLRRAFAQR